MTKKQAATKKSTSVKLIVFGLLDGKQRAGTFAEADAALATKAATELGLSVLEVTDKETKELAAKLRPGKVHATASGFLPAVPKAVYGKLTGSIGIEKKGVGNLHLPKTFADITVGSIVASHDADETDGLWPAVVTKQSGDIFIHSLRRIVRHQLVARPQRPKQGVHEDVRGAQKGCAQRFPSRHLFGCSELSKSLYPRSTKSSFKQCTTNATAGDQFRPSAVRRQMHL